MAKRTATPATPGAADAASQALSIAQHPLYNAFMATWVLLAHVREGTGPFMDGTALVPHPREWQDYDLPEPKIPTKKLLARRRLACYENIAGTILESKQSALFRETPSRRFGGTSDAPTTGDAKALQDWWENVDGAGCDIDDFMAGKWDIAGTFGHLWIYLDRPKGQSGSTVADALQPFLRVYTPLDVENWTVNDRYEVTSILFREPSERMVGRCTYRLVNTEWWAHYNEDGVLDAGGQVDGLHQMGVLPAVQLFARRRPMYRHVGQSVLGDPKLYQDLYNLTSEIRELLRNQTFSFINIPLGTGDQAMSVETAKAMLGGAIGAMNVIFSGQAAQILAGDANNVIVYHKEFDRRLRTIYRLAGVQWEADSKDAEASGSLKLKREDMNTRLAAYADEVEKVDYALARLWFRAMRGADAGQRAFEDAKVEIRYPDTFDMTPFDVVLQQAQAALSLDFPRIVMNEILKVLLPKFLPDLDEATLKTLTDAIDAMTEESTTDLRTELLRIANDGNPKSVAVAGEGTPGAAPVAGATVAA